MTSRYRFVVSVCQDLDNDDEWMSDEDDEEAEFQREQDARRKAAEQRALQDYSSSDEEDPAGVMRRSSARYSSSDEDYPQTDPVTSALDSRRRQQVDSSFDDGGRIPQRNDPNRRTLSHGSAGRCSSSSDGSFDEMDKLSGEPGQHEMGE